MVENMLLLNKPTLQLEFEQGFSINLQWNFDTLYNIDILLRDKYIKTKLHSVAETPLKIYDSIKDNLGVILYASCSDVENDFVKIVEFMDNIENEEFADTLCSLIQNIIFQSINYIEPKDDSASEGKTKASNTKADTRTPSEVWEEYFNYFYCLAVDELNMTEDEFLSSTPNQIKERAYRHKIRFLNREIELYLKLHSGNGKGAEEENEVIICDDLFDFANKLGS